MNAYRFRASNRLKPPFDEAQFFVTVLAENEQFALKLASEFGFKHHLLLTYIEPGKG